MRCLSAHPKGAGDGLAALERAHALERRRSSGPRGNGSAAIKPARQFAATSADWLKPRSTARPMQRHRHQQPIVPRRPAAPCSAPSSAIATLRPYLSRIASRATDRHRRPRRGSAIRGGWRGTAQVSLGRLERSPQVAAASPRNRLLPAIGAKTVHFDDRAAAGAARRKRKIERRTRKSGPSTTSRLVAHGCASAQARRAQVVRHGAARASPRPGGAHRARAFPLRARIRRLPRSHCATATPFRSTLLIGCPDPDWPERLAQASNEVTVRDPGPLFAAAASGQIIVEDDWEPPAAAYDLVLAVGTLDTVNDLPLALRLVRHSMRDDALLIGALSGGDTLPALRSAMRAADSVDRRCRASRPSAHRGVRAGAACLATPGFIAGGRCRSGARSPILRSTGWSATFAQWARPTSLLARPPLRRQAQAEPPHCVRFATPATGHVRSRPSKSSISPPGHPREG